jgi:hypothetical protein
MTPSAAVGVELFATIRLFPGVHTVPDSELLKGKEGDCGGGDPEHQNPVAAILPVELHP